MSTQEEELLLELEVEKLLLFELEEEELLELELVVLLELEVVQVELGPLIARRAFMFTHGEQPFWRQSQGQGH